MHTNARLGRGIGLGIHGLAAIAAFTLVSAPTAAADIVSVDVELGGDQQFYVGKTYYLTARIDAEDGLGNTPTVTFSDGSQCLGAVTVPSVNVQARMPWVFTKPGAHSIFAKQGLDKDFITINVVAAPAGSTPAAQPKITGCGANSGSSALDALTSGSAGS